MREAIRLAREGRALVKDDVDEGQLLCMLIERHPRAARASWLRFAPLVHRLLKRALGPDADIRELAQRVFVQLFRRVAELRHPIELRPLVIALAAKTIRAELRIRSVRRWLPVAQSVVPPRTSSMPPEPPSREVLRRLYSLLDTCRTEDRIAFAFHFLEGLSLEEVAAALHLSLPAAQVLLARAWSRIVIVLEHDIALLEYLSNVEGQGACA